MTTKCAICDPLLAPGLCTHTEGEYAQPVEHQHIWAKNGCWCGAKQCVYYGDDGRVELCTNAAVKGSKYCERHSTWVCSNCWSPDCDGRRCC